MTGDWVIRVHVQREFFFALESLHGWELFCQFRPQGFLEMADDRSGSVRDGCANRYHSVRGRCAKFDTNWWTVFVWLSIDHHLTDTNR